MIALASDHAGFPLKNAIAQYLTAREIPFSDLGTHTGERCDYPEYGLMAATAVASGRCEKGILVCGTGVGIGIAANKVKGIRCVTCTEPYSAVLSRKHNDANMLSLGARVVGEGLALMIVEQWLAADFEGGRHGQRVGLITQIEQTGEIVSGGR
ncbi:MAG: ribose 5-phosphate isomerase B [Oscillospiraceae bacterium]|nr:ribose 5-phosphate isomerase B [Oscillospiraceae bacterium]